MERRNEKDFLECSDARYGIYQIKEDEAGEAYHFLGLDLVKSRNMTVKKEDYELVYQGELRKGDTVETFYEMFNLNRPDDYTGYSLSVSDVVVFKRNGECRAFYVDRAGSVELPDFFHGESLQKSEGEPEQKEPGQEEGFLTLHVKGPFGSTTEKVRLEVSTYGCNGNIAIELVGRYEDGYEEPYSNLTTNFDGELPPFCGYVDTNHLPGAEDFIRENRLGTFTHMVKPSGYCVYPLYHFDADRLRELCPAGVLAYEQEKGISQDQPVRTERR